MMFGSAHSSRITINLLPQDPFYETPLGRALSWASTVGRYLVIFTELMVIASFAARFQLDRTLTDLNSAIVQKSAIVDSYGQLEDQVRAVQDKTAFISQQTSTHSPLDVLDLLGASLPADVTYASIQLRDGSINVTGIALSPEALGNLVRLLQRQPLVSALYLNQVKTSSTGTAGLEFIIQLELTGKKTTQMNSGSET